MKMKVKLDPGAYLPTRAHETDAGLDLYAPYDFTIPGKASAVIDTGVHVAIPATDGFCCVGLVKSKSGLMVKDEITTDGTIDAGYTGSIKVKLFNHGFDNKQFFRGQKIAQLVILPIITPGLELVSDLEATERGDGGFGSTGAFADHINNRFKGEV